MNKVSFALMLKGFLLLIVYGFLVINFVFLAPKTVPKLDDLEIFEVGKNAIYCVENGNKNPAYTKIIGILENKELKTYDIGTERCLEIFGITAQYIRYKKLPKKYKIYVEDDKVRLFGEGWLLYQIEANGEILLSYEETSKAYLQERMKFFYISLTVLVLITIPLFRAGYRHIKN